jgi:hypothetical protein
MRLALLDFEDKPLPMPHGSLERELRRRLSKKLWTLTSRRTVLDEISTALAEIEAELREHSRRV